MEIIGTIVIVGTVFFGVFSLIKVFTDYLLKRKIVNAGHIEKAGILDAPAASTSESKSYPNLKWGLVALMAGLGLILIEILDRTGAITWQDGSDSFLPFGIELVAISLGFLIYFFIVNAKNMKSR